MNFPSFGGGQSSSTSTGGSGAAAKPSGGSKPPGKPESISGSFDPTALERGAKALKELDVSPNAAKAFEITRLQEVTKQKELHKETEQFGAAKAQALSQRVQLEGEERRKCTTHQQEEERITAQYRAQLEAEAYSKKLQDQKKQNEEWLSMQHQQYLRQEEQRKHNELELEKVRARRHAEQAALDRETQRARIAEETRGKIEQERVNSDVHLNTLRARASEERRTKMKQLSSVMSGVGGACASILDNKERLTAVVGGFTALALGVYGARAGVGVAARVIERNLGRPPLVKETSRWSFARGTCDYFKNLFVGKPEYVERVVLPPELSERMEWTRNALLNSRKNGTPFRHLLLYGPPGTGKTLFARTLARESGLDYAIMSGGDVGPLGSEAVSEINKLFKWANNSRKGLILFIDEAESFLRVGRGKQEGMSENMRNVISSFLHHTGTESDRFCVILATNERHILDRAVVDRVDEGFNFPLPALPERKRMLDMFVKEYLKTPTRKGKCVSLTPEFDNDDYYDFVALQTEGFSGRQLAKLVIGWQSAAFGTGTMTVTRGLADVVLQWKLAHRDEDTHINNDTHTHTHTQTQ
eukprot:GHVR01092573.1.p1 GENE.GHVR01092573.1~~GHVR01092573.1.p1  ORF type:complete len:587 (+),score=163.53 GHVR01092573.1:40-1800(+)